MKIIKKFIAFISLLNMFYFLGMGIGWAINYLNETF